MLVRLDVAPAMARDAARRVLNVVPEGDPPDGGATGALIGPLFGDTETDTSARLRVECTPDGNGSAVRLEGSSTLTVPYFGWFVQLIVLLAARRALRDAAARLRASVSGEPAPVRAERSRMLPPAAFTAEHARRLAALAAVGTIAAFGGALLTQNGDAVTRSFSQSDQALGLALAIARAGVLVSLLASALSDRYGRRRLMIWCLVGVCVANAVSAAAPSFEVFAGAQLFARAFVNGTLVVASVAVIEEAPEVARAFAFSMFALALGLGFGVSVVLLPAVDLGSDAWRLAFGLSALTVVLLPSVARNLHETRRFTGLRQRTKQRARLRETFDSQYGRRFLLLGLVAFLANVFSAPSSQLTNRYLTKVHAYSNSEVALFRSVTSGVPGIVGVLLAGRLAETRGRRPVIMIGLLVASVFQMVFFLGDGVLLWIMPMIAIVAAACAGLGVGAANAELFPTEARGTSNGFLLACGVAGAAVGLVVATHLEHLVGGLGPAIAICGIAPLAAALLVVPRLPETRARTLDEISPSEV
jgi:MFS family permease